MKERKRKRGRRNKKRRKRNKRKKKDLEISLALFHQDFGVILGTKWVYEDGVVGISRLLFVVGWLQVWC
jgi:hypothetical protein